MKRIFHLSFLFFLFSCGISKQLKEDSKIVIEVCKSIGLDKINVFVKSSLGADNDILFVSANATDKLDSFYLDNSILIPSYILFNLREEKVAFSYDFIDIKIYLENDSVVRRFSSDELEEINNGYHKVSDIIYYAQSDKEDIVNTFLQDSLVYNKKFWSDIKKFEACGKTFKTEFVGAIKGEIENESYWFILIKYKREKSQEAFEAFYLPKSEKVFDYFLLSDNDCIEDSLN